MQYLLLIYDDETKWADMPGETAGRMNEAYAKYTQAIRDSGHLVGGEALTPSSTATTVRVRDGKTLTTDGPFAETREQLGGYYLVEASDLDEAIGLAARIPSAESGSIEIRPIRVFTMT